MAAGNTYWFVSYLERVFDFADVDFGATPHALKIAFIKSVANGGITPSITTAYPTWGAAGSTNMSSYQVTPGGNYPTGGLSLATPVSTVNGAILEIDFSNPASIAQDAANPTNARWGIIYDDGAANKDCIAYYDLGADRDLTTGEFQVAMGTPALQITCS